MTSIFPLWTVIPNWNLKDDTQACIESLLVAARGLDVHVLVVDQASTDGSAEALTAAFDGAVTVLGLAANLGFAGGVNHGIGHALKQGAGSVLVLNNDTLIDSDMLQALCRAAETHSNLAVLAPAIYYAGDPGRIWRLGDRQSRWSPIPHKVRPTEVQRELVPVDYVTGCAMLVRRDVFDEVGLFDERFFMYYEDADFCRRASAAGYRLACVPLARMWHKVSTTARRDAPVNTFWRARGHVIFYRKHWRGLSGVAVHPYLILKALVAAARYGFRREWSCVHASLRGTIAGYGLSLQDAGRTQDHAGAGGTRS